MLEAIGSTPRSLLGDLSRIANLYDRVVKIGCVLARIRFYCRAFRECLARSCHPTNAAKCLMLGEQRTLRKRPATSHFDPSVTLAV